MNIFLLKISLKKVYIYENQNESAIVYVHNKKTKP